MAAQPHKKTHGEDCQLSETLGTVDSKRPPQLDKVRCRSREGCVCATSRANLNSKTPKVKEHHLGGTGAEATACDISDTESIYEASVDGQEGAERQVEGENVGWNDVHTMQRPFERQGIPIHIVHNHPKCRECAQVCNGCRDAVGSVSPEDSMLVETGSVPPNMALSQVSLPSSAGRHSLERDLAGIGRQFADQATYEYAHSLEI